MEQNTFTFGKESKRKKRPKSVHHTVPSTETKLAPTKKFWQRHRRNASDTPPLEFIPSPLQSPSPPPDPPQQQGADRPDYQATAAVEEAPPKKPVRVKVKHDDSPPPLTMKLDNPPDKPPRRKVKVKDENDVWESSRIGSSKVKICRSCSVDALNEIGDEKTERLSMKRRGSFEVSE